MRILVLFALLVSLFLCSYGRVLLTRTDDDDKNDWDDYLEKYLLNFTEEEYWRRFKIFTENLRYIEKRNNEGLSYKLGITKFSHMTNLEYQQLLKTSGTKKYREKRVYREFSSGAEIHDIDYRKLGMVTEVKDQGPCGSCWAFSAVGCLESQNLLQNRSLKTYSEQQLVDCSWNYGNLGCGGGFMDNAFHYVADHGLSNDTAYKYTARNQKCYANQSKAEIFVDNYFDIPEANEIALQLALIEHGPISVAIDASSIDFQIYSGGIFNISSCSSTRINHGVLLVGIGSEPSPYYIVKNSWGSHWGDKGYILMSRDKNNQCGIATAASYATVKYKN